MLFYILNVAYIRKQLMLLPLLIVDQSSIITWKICNDLTMSITGDEQKVTRAILFEIGLQIIDVKRVAVLQLR